MPVAGCTMRRLHPPKADLRPTLELERALWAQGVRYVAGLDEAGRGAWAGPVVAGCVILPPHPNLENEWQSLRDSKGLTPNQRARWRERICQVAIAWGVGMAWPEEIDHMGILPATRLAMQRALEQAGLPVEHLLLDALRLPGLSLPQTALIRGDMQVMSIAAASILAKTARDALMSELDRDYPGYGFAHHKGYGVPAHRLALQRLGPSPIHRRSFGPLRHWLVTPASTQNSNPVIR